MNKVLTIFTPTYNRAYILDKLYNSLLVQSSNNFEWLIVDDGSTDNTKELIKGWMKENKIIIKYYYQKNHGKSIAHNMGVLKCNTELFTCVDSDDYLTNDAVEELVNSYKSIKNIDFITGIIARKETINNKNNNKFPNIKYTTLTDLCYKFNCDCDYLLAYKTNIIKKFEFPKIKDEKFVPEIYIYDQIDQLGKMLFLNKVLYMYEYLDDGYTVNSKKIIKDNPKGYIIACKQKMKLNNSLKVIIKNAIRYNIGNLIIKNRHFVKELNSLKLKIIVILLYPISFYAYYKRYK